MKETASLQQLKDIHLPSAIHFWPIAPGWIACYLILSALALYAIYYFHQRNQYRYVLKVALQQLKALRNLQHHNPDNVSVAAEISILMRRTALHYFSRKKIAGLSGDAWLAFLNKTGHTEQFSGVNGQLLLAAPYQKNSDIDTEPLFNLAEQWLLAIAKKNNTEK